MYLHSQCSSLDDASCLMQHQYFPLNSPGWQSLGNHSCRSGHQNASGRRLSKTRGVINRFCTTQIYAYKRNISTHTFSMSQILHSKYKCCQYWAFLRYYLQLTHHNHGCTVYTEHAKTAAASCGTSQVTTKQPNCAVSTSLWRIFKNAWQKQVIHLDSHMTRAHLVCSSSEKSAV